MFKKMKKDEKTKGYIVLLLSLILAFSGLSLAVLAEKTTEVSFSNSGLLTLRVGEENTIYPPSYSHGYMSGVKNVTLILWCDNAATINIRLSVLNITYSVDLEPRKNKTIFLGQPQIVYLSLNSTNEVLVSISYVYCIEAYIKKNLWLSIPAAILAFTGMGLAYVGLTSIFIGISQTKRKTRIK